MGPLFAVASAYQQKKQAEAYQRINQRAMIAQADATDRAKVELQYIGGLIQPEMRKIDGRWYAAFWGKTNIPRCNPTP